MGLIDLVPSRDASNQSDMFLRNRVRHAVLPALGAENPNLEATLCRTAVAMREVAEALDWAADTAARTAVVDRAPGAIQLDADILMMLPAGVRKRLLGRVASELGCSLEARHLDALAALPALPRGRSLDLPRLTARRALTRIDLQAKN